MKAILFTEYGPADLLKLGDVPKPVPKPNEILVKVHATTVTSADVRIRTSTVPAGFWLLTRLAFGLVKPRISILGNEFAGVVESVGEKVTLFKSGDRVFGMNGGKFGAQAEYLCVADSTALALMPANLSFEEAASIPFGGLSALYFLRAAKIQPGHKILILGASGNLGTAAVQLATYFGAHVTAVCSGANAALVRSLGANVVIDYTKEDFTQSDTRYDSIFDTLGKTSFLQSQPLLKPNGIFLAAVAGLPDFGKMLWTSLRGGQQLFAGMATEKPEDLVFLKKLVEAGKLHAVIDRRYSLDQTAEAHRYVEKGHKKGSVVITI